MFDQHNTVENVYIDGTWHSYPCSTPIWLLGVGFATMAFISFIGWISLNYMATNTGQPAAVVVAPPPAPVILLLPEALKKQKRLQRVMKNLQI